MVRGRHRGCCSRGEINGGFGAVCLIIRCRRRSDQSFDRMGGKVTDLAMFR
jgi:hypothetical protein